MHRLSSMAVAIALITFVMAISFALIAAGWLITTYLLKEVTLILLPI